MVYVYGIVVGRFKDSLPCLPLLRLGRVVVIWRVCLSLVVRAASRMAFGDREV